MQTHEKAETLAHRPDWGEVDPRTYPLVGTVRFACDKIGDHRRIAQANRLVIAVDAICEQEGETRARVHLTVPPGGDARQAVEVRVQPLTRRSEAEDKALAGKIIARWAEVLERGKGFWSAV